MLALDAVGVLGEGRHPFGELGEPQVVFDRVVAVELAAEAVEPAPDGSGPGGVAGAQAVEGDGQAGAVAAEGAVHDGEQGEVRRASRGPFDRGMRRCHGPTVAPAPCIGVASARHELGSDLDPVQLGEHRDQAEAFGQLAGSRQVLVRPGPRGRIVDVE